jgi:hypothetical protein
MLLKASAVASAAVMDSSLNPREENAKTFIDSILFSCLNNKIFHDQLNNFFQINTEQKNKFVTDVSRAMRSNPMFTATQN